MNHIFVSLLCLRIIRPSKISQDYDSNAAVQDAALTARGLFAGDILRSALHKRHRVEFGVDDITWRQDWVEN